VGRGSNLVVWLGASQLQSKQKVALNVYLPYKQKAALKNQEWKGLETPIHYRALGHPCNL